MSALECCSTNTGGERAGCLSILQTHPSRSCLKHPARRPSAHSACEKKVAALWSHSSMQSLAAAVVCPDLPYSLGVQDDALIAELPGQGG